MKKSYAIHTKNSKNDTLSLHSVDDDIFSCFMLMNKLVGIVKKYGAYMYNEDGELVAELDEIKGFYAHNSLHKLIGYMK